MSTETVQYEMLLSDAQRDRDAEAVSRRCQPLRVGTMLILLMAIATTVYVASSPRMSGSSVLSLGTLYLSSALTLSMLYSLCERNSQNAAWLTVLLAPVVIALFSSQIDYVLYGLTTAPVSSNVAVM